MVGIATKAKERWTVTKGPRNPLSDTGIGSPPAIKNPSGDYVAVMGAGNVFFKDAEANARRIVACLNACEGIPTEALEENMIIEMIAAAKKVLRYALEVDEPGYPDERVMAVAVRIGDFRGLDAAITRAEGGT